MFRYRGLAAFLGFIALLAVSATTASAWWESNLAENKGHVKVLQSGVFSVGEGTSKAEVKCPAAGVVASWSIQTKGQIKVHNENEKQMKTKAGPHMHLTVQTWGTECKAKIGGATEIAAEVKPCELQAVQPQKGVNTATGGVVTGCRIKAGNCEIIVPAGMETQPGSNEGINVGLKEITLEAAGASNSLAKINVGGVRSEKQPNTPGCVLLALYKTGELKGVEGELEGAKLI